MAKDNYREIFENKKRVLVVFAHPDDAELYAGGTVAKLVKDGKRVRIVKVTSGNRGSRQEDVTESKLMEIRESEDTKAMEILGIQKEDNIYLRLGDGEVDNSMMVIEKLARQIREFQPDIIVTHNPEDVVIRFDKGVNWVNHRDHRNTGLSAVDAAYPYSRDKLFFPKHFQEGLKSGEVKEFLFVDYYDHPDLVYIDVTECIETRIRAHAAHASQYTRQHAQESADFFTKRFDDNRRYEVFRHVAAD